MVICDNSKDSPKIGVLRLAHRSRSWPLLRTRPWYPQRGQPIPTGGRYDREAPTAGCQRGGCSVRRWVRGVSVSAMRCQRGGGGAKPVGARCQCQRDVCPARCQRGGGAVSALWLWVRAWVCAPRCTGRSPARTSAWMVATARWTGMPQARAQTGREPGSGDHVLSYITRVSGFGMVPGRYCRYDSHLGR